jgi:hypothetical protein
VDSILPRHCRGVCWRYSHLCSYAQRYASRSRNTVQRLTIVDEKYKLEEFGIRYIESLLQLVDPKLGAAIRAGWEEYENGNTPKATPAGKWVREMDKFECMIQAHEYEQRTYGEKNLEEFQGQAKYIKSEEGKEMLELLQQEREAHFRKRKQRTPVIFIIGISCCSWLAFVLTIVQALLALTSNATSYPRNLAFSTYP